MSVIKEEYIDFIYTDIQKKGIQSKDLQDNIVDHICCMAEENLKVSADFYTFYEAIIPRFYNSELKELQDETNLLLTSKLLYQMKHLLKVTGIISVIALALGVLFKIYHLQGAGVLLVTGGIIFGVLFFPLLIGLKLKDKDSKSNKVLTSIGFIIAMVAALSCIFKIMHWPWANVLRMSSILSFLILFIPMYYYVKNKNPETKFNALMHTVIMGASGIILFAMTF